MQTYSHPFGSSGSAPPPHRISHHTGQILQGKACVLNISIPCFDIQYTVMTICVAFVYFICLTKSYLDMISSVQEDVGGLFANSNPII